MSNLIHLLVVIKCYLCNFVQSNTICIDGIFQGLMTVCRSNSDLVKRNKRTNLGHNNDINNIIPGNNYDLFRFKRIFKNLKKI